MSKHSRLLSNLSELSHKFALEREIKARGIVVSNDIDCIFYNHGYSALFMATGHLFDTGCFRINFWSKQIIF